MLQKSPNTSDVCCLLVTSSMRLSGMGCALWLVLLCVVCAHSQSTGQGSTSIPATFTQSTNALPDCSNQLFRRAIGQSNLSPNALNSSTGAQYMYVARNQLCDVDMDCGSLKKQMTISVALATSGQGMAQGVCAKFEVVQIPPFSNECLQVFQAPPGQLSNQLSRPIYIGITVTRSFVYYPLVPVNKINSVAYTYAQFSSTTSPPDFTCSTTPNACDAAFLQTLKSASASVCTPEFISDNWGDSQNDPLIMEKCGANADFPQEIFITDSKSCGQTCCSPCGSSASRTTFRRWPFGPQCQIYAVQPPQLRVYGGLVVSFNSDLSDGEEVRFQTPVDADGTITYVGGLQSNLNFLSASRKIRVHVNQRAQAPSSLQRIDGYVVVCSSAKQTTRRMTCDMGASNPYVQSPVESPCLTAYSPQLAQTVPKVAPAGATPDQLRTGTVPTYTSMNNPDWQCSWYYVPQNQSQAIINSPNAAVFAKEIRSRMALALFPNLATPDGANTICPGNNAGIEYFDKFVGVPGWELDPATMQPKVTSICQMSHALNTYAQLYQSFYSVSHDADAAMAQAAPPPIWLLPEYSIARPNWWLHDEGLMFDLGLTYPQRTGLELLVQLSEEEYMSLEIVDELFRLKLPETSCAVVVGNGTGSMQLAVQGLYPSTQVNSVSQFMQVNCSTTRNGTVTLRYPNGTVVNNATNLLPFEALQSGVVLAHVLSMSFVNQTQYVVNDGPFVQCTVQLLNDQLKPYGDLTTLMCRTTLGNASLAVTYAEEIDIQEGSRTFLYVGLGVVGGVLVILLLVLFIVWISSVTSSDARDYLAQNVGDFSND